MRISTSVMWSATLLEIVIVSNAIVLSHLRCRVNRGGKSSYGCAVIHLFCGGCAGHSTFYHRHPFRRPSGATPSPHLDCTFHAGKGLGWRSQGQSTTRLQGRPDRGVLSGAKSSGCYLCESRMIVAGTLHQSVNQQLWEYAFNDHCEYSIYGMYDVALMPSGELALNNVRGLAGHEMCGAWRYWTEQ